MEEFLSSRETEISAPSAKRQASNWWSSTRPPKRVEAEAEYFGLLKTRNLLIFRDAQNARNGKFASNWNVPGTRFFGERWDLRELAIGSIWLQRLSGLGTACIFKS